MAVETAGVFNGGGEGGGIKYLRNDTLQMDYR
jgi:hypothetical protein